MFFLIFYYFSFAVFGVFFIMQEMRHNKKANYFLQDDDDTDDDDDDNDYDYVEDKQENAIKQKYEDKYKINKEIVDDELSQEKLEQLYNYFVIIFE